MHGLKLTAAAGVVFMAIATACTGEDASPGGSPPDGAEGGACFGNHSCLTDLFCSASNICVRLASGSDASGSQTNADGPTSTDHPDGDTPNNADATDAPVTSEGGFDAGHDGDAGGSTFPKDASAEGG